MRPLEGQVLIRIFYRLFEIEKKLLRRAVTEENNSAASGGMPIRALFGLTNIRRSKVYGGLCREMS